MAKYARTLLFFLWLLAPSSAFAQHQPARLSVTYGTNPQVLYTIDSHGHYIALGSFPIGGPFTPTSGSGTINPGSNPGALTFYAAAGNTVSALSQGTTGQCLISAGANSPPVWSTCPSSSGTVNPSAVIGALTYYAAVGNVASALTQGTTGQCLISAGPNNPPSWATCPGGSGGSGTVNPSSVIGAVPYYSAATNAVGPLSSQGTTGQFLTSQGVGAAPTWTTPINVGAAIGQLALYGAAGMVVSPLTAQGTSGQCLTSQGANALPTWGICGGSTVSLPGTAGDILTKATASTFNNIAGTAANGVDTMLGNAPNAVGGALTMPITAETNTDMANAVQLASGALTYTFTGRTFSVAPVCMCQDMDNSANGCHAVATVGSPTTLALTGSGTDHVEYSCMRRD